jgi:hypothetical protein
MSGSCWETFISVGELAGKDHHQCSHGSPVRPLKAVKSEVDDGNYQSL